MESLYTYQFVKDISFEVINSIFEGGPGSGHWGHKGRPGYRGGSLPAGTKKGMLGVDVILDYPNQQIGWKNQINKALTNIPKNLINDAGWLSIYVHDGNSFVKMNEEWKMNDAAVFVAPHREIHINEFGMALKLGEQIRLIRHEIAHHVDLGGMDRQDQAKFSNSKSWLRVHEKEAGKISNYSRQNPMESFAEAFSMYASPGRFRNALEKHAPEAFAYMKNLFEGGVKIQEQFKKLVEGEEIDALTVALGRPPVKFQERWVNRMLIMRILEK
jgi:hypothetical protein